MLIILKGLQLVASSHGDRSRSLSLPFVQWWPFRRAERGGGGFPPPPPPLGRYPVFWCILGMMVTTYHLLFIQIHSLHPDLQGLDKLTSLPIVVILILRPIMIPVL